MLPINSIRGRTMSNRAKAVFAALHLLAAVAFGWLGHAWLYELQPSWPIVPQLLGASALLNLGTALWYASGITPSR